MMIDITTLPPHDNSMLATWRRCGRLYQIQHVKKRISAIRPIYFDYGSMMHAGLENWYKELKASSDPRTSLTAAHEAIEAFPWEDDPTDFRTKARAHTLMDGYVKQWLTDDSWEIVATETPFTIKADGIHYGGRIDLLVEYMGQLWIIDHKTTSTFGPTYYNRFFPDSQTAGYMWTVSKLHGRMPAGAWLNILVTRKNNSEYDRRQFPYAPFYVEEWFRQTVHDLGEISVAYATDYWTTRGWEHCVDKFQKKCPEYETCRSLPENREQLIQDAMHKPNTWDWMEG